jgi:hypothetical protein
MHVLPRRLLGERRDGLDRFWLGSRRGHAPSEGRRSTRAVDRCHNEGGASKGGLNEGSHRPISRTGLADENTEMTGRLVCSLRMPGMSDVHALAYSGSYARVRIPGRWTDFMDHGMPSFVTQKAAATAQKSYAVMHSVTPATSSTIHHRPSPAPIRTLGTAGAGGDMVPTPDKSPAPPYLPPPCPFTLLTHGTECPLP